MLNIALYSSIYNKQNNSMPKKTIPPHQMEQINEISAFIRNWRLNQNMSQVEFVQLSNSPVHLNTLQNFESLKKNISLISLLSIIDATGLSLSEFFEEMV